MSNQSIIRVYNKPLIKAVVIDGDNDNDFFEGHCFYNDHENFYIQSKPSGKDIIQINGQTIYAPKPIEEWYFCPICKIKWRVGVNRGIFSLPDENTLGQPISEYLRINTKKLSDYEDFTGREIDFCNLFLGEA